MIHQSLLRLCFKKFTREGKGELKIKLFVLEVRGWDGREVSNFIYISIWGYNFELLKEKSHFFYFFLLFDFFRANNKSFFPLSSPSLLSSEARFKSLREMQSFSNLYHAKL